jgi:hypothetical protein
MLAKQRHFVYIYLNVYNDHWATTEGVLVRCRLSRLNSSRWKRPDELGPILDSHSFWFRAESDTWFRAISISSGRPPKEGCFWDESSLLAGLPPPTELKCEPQFIFQSPTWVYVSKNQWIVGRGGTCSVSSITKRNKFYFSAWLRRLSLTHASSMGAMIE